MTDDQQSAFNLLEARKAVFDKFPSDLKCLHVYRHFYTDLDEEASQLSLQWFALLISYFCGLCRLEGRRAQYTQNGNSERFGSEFAKAHHRAAILFERLTSCYRKILTTYNTHSKIRTRKRVGPRVINETFKMGRYVAGAKCNVDKLSYESQYAFLYALDELRFYEELFNFTVQILKRAFTDERLQAPIIQEMTHLFRSEAFSFKHDQRLGAVDKTRKRLEEARCVDSILHNCQRLAQRLVAPPEPTLLKLALRQRSPFVAAQWNHPLLTMLSYQRAFARKELDRPPNNEFHVRLPEGEESPFDKEARELKEELHRRQNQRTAKPVVIARRGGGGVSGGGGGGGAGTTSNIHHSGHDDDDDVVDVDGNSRRTRTSSPYSFSPDDGHHAGEPSPPNSRVFWDRVGTTPEENAYTVEVNQPMFAPSHRALSSLTPVGLAKLRQRKAAERAKEAAREKNLTNLPADSLLPRLHDFDRPNANELPLPRRVDTPVDHTTEILYGRGTPLGRQPSVKALSSKMPLGARFRSVASKIATASGVRTNEDQVARSEQKAIDRLVSAAAATSAMSCKTRAVIDSDPTNFFIAPLDPSTGKEDFTMYDPTSEIDAVYQQLAHGVQLTHFSVPIDIGIQYDATGMLVVE